ncbi:Hypothetical protein A7982_10038 [Minicystis rosea]|nr:Hypothetical protein A7982_10038 [Minicystis rosea]
MRLTPKISLVAAILAGTVIACGGTPKPEANVPEAPPPPPPPKAEAAPVGPPMLPANVLTKLDDENAAPYFARRGEDGLLLYASKGRWISRAAGADGAPKSAETREVATMGSDPTMASLKAVGDGYLAVWTERVAKNNAIKVMALDAEGKAKGEPALVTQVTDDVTWIDVLPNKKGALLVWEVPRDDRSDVFVAPVSDVGKSLGAASAVAQGVVGWEAEPTERGAALAMVTSDAAAPVAAKKRKPAKTAEEASARGTKLGKVLFTEIDDKGKAAAPVVVSADPTAQLDVTVAEVGGKYVLAWTDERNIDASVYLAVVEPGGKIAAAPHRATAPFGEQALVSLVAEGWAPATPRSKRALLAWEDQLRAPRDGRLIHLATVGPDGALGKERGALVFSASGPPDIVPDGEGFAAVTLAPVHELPEGVAARPQLGVKGDPVWASYVRFGPDLSVLAAEPVRAAPFAETDGVPYITRTLTCGGGQCTAIGMAAVTPAKGPEAPAVPAPLALISLPKRQSPWKAPAYREPDEAPPRAASVNALFDGDHLAKVTAADLPGGGTLAAWVTYVIEAAGARRGKRAKPANEDGPAATLSVRPIGADGAPGKPVTITNKAVSIGGVALAPAPGRDGKKSETAAAWVARVRGEPQVFVTKLGPDGEKLGEKGVTVISRKGKKKGAPSSEASDVAIAYAGGESAAGDGWITAWVDTRDGNAEVYVAKLDRSLTKVVPDKRITEAVGDASEVQIAVRGKDVFLVWSDGRAKPDEGSGDIYVARLDAATLKKTGPETRLFASATHSRTPQILPTAKGFVVAWIEEGEAGKRGDEGAGVRIAELDEKGMPVGAPQLVRPADGQGTVTSTTLGCTAKACRGVITTAVGEALVLGAFELTPGSTAGPVKTIAALTGGANQDVSPVFAGPSATSLFFADDAVSGTGRVRWMQIAWP